MKTRSTYLFIALFLPLSLFSQNSIRINQAANAFLASLNQDELKKVNYSFQDSVRKKWTNLPVGMVPRPGIQYGSMSDKSRLAFHRVLSALLSSQGYLKTTSIMQLDDILNTLYQEAYDKGEIKKEFLTQMQKLNWAHGNYYISIFGKPGDAPWGMNFGGHHMALSLTSDGKKISMSPYFIGTDPSEVKSSKYAGLRVLSKEEDYGFMLINMLSDAQKSKAILQQAVPKDIITNPNSQQRIDSYYGIAVKEFSDAQKAVLKMLIQEYVHNFEHEKSHQMMDKIAATGMDKIHFAWVGSLENNKSHYYIINGPDFLIEYDNVGFQNDGNHIHAILREKGNDFGADLLKMHYLESKH